MTTTEPETTKSKLQTTIERHYGKASALCYVSAFVVFGLLISEYLCDKTYFSDNALLPGFVRRDFGLKQQTLNNLRELRSLKLEHRNADESSSRLPIDWLVNKFGKHGLQIYTQQFEFQYPFGDKRNLTGTNVYAVFRGTRSLGTEALVLSSPFRLNSRTAKSTLPGISLMISLAEYFSTKNYWSKDLIFLIYEHELIGCEAWLNSYYDLNDGNEKQKRLIKSEPLEDRVGIIQAAINLEITSEQTPNLEIKIEGLNGQLPNLDLFNVVVEIASRDSIDATFHQLSHLFSPDQMEIWIEYAKSVGAMMKSQASTFTNGAHGLFQKRSIQSLTLVVEEDESDQDYLKADLAQVGKVIEGVFRSCNNLIERFNRSYWFFLLASTRRYISIAFYMIPLALLVVPSLLRALVIYLQAVERHQSMIDTFWQLLPQLCWIHGNGIALVTLPLLIQDSSKLQAYFGHKTEELLFYSLLVLMSSLTFSPLVNQDSSAESDEPAAVRSADGDKLAGRLAEAKQAQRSKLISIRHYVALLELALVIVCLSLVNISLALGLAVIYIPSMCSISIDYKLQPPHTRSTFRKVINALHKLLLLLLNPLTLLYLCALGESIYTGTDQTPLIHLKSSFNEQKHALLALVEHWFLFGNWIFLIGCVVLYPLWLQFWFLL